MKKKMTTVPFEGTAEQKVALDAVIAKYKDEPGALMPILQEAQDIYGYLPVEVQKDIAAGLDIPVSEVFGVAEELFGVGGEEVLLDVGRDGFSFSLAFF